MGMERLVVIAVLYVMVGLYGIGLLSRLGWMLGHKPPAGRVCRAGPLSLRVAVRDVTIGQV